MGNKYPLLMLLLSAFSQPLMADSHPDKGQAFTIPDKQLTMPAGWEAKPIQYSDSAKDADLVINFGQQTYPAMHELVKQYAKDNHLKIVVTSGTCGVSAGKLLQKSLDSGTFCCPPDSKDRLPGLEFHTIAISALAIFVNQKNPVHVITTDEARRILQGKIRNWSELDSGKKYNYTIRPQARLHCKQRPGHWTLILKDLQHFSPTLKEVGVIPDLVAKVGQEEDAVSIETPFMIGAYQKDPVKMLKLDGFAATDIDYVASGKYPFYRTYNMTTWSKGGKQRKEALKLINFLKGHLENNYHQYAMVPVSKLKKAGWKFKGDELIGEPDGSKLALIPPQH